jgi:hypothetical protein
MKTLVARIGHGLAQIGFLTFLSSGATAAVVTGNALEFNPNITHPNGNVYDQVLMTGTTATVKTDPGQVVRVSFVDLNDDIIQVEFGGAGTLTVALAAATGPAAAKKYNQPGVLYMKGHAALTVSDSDATTNISVFSVGTMTALDPGLFRTDEFYDGIADLQNLVIVANPVNPNGSTFGAIRMGNVQFWGTSGIVGISATKIQVQDVVRVGDLWALDTATPTLTFGSASQFGSVDVAGGDLSQPNGSAVQAQGYFYSVNPTSGRTSNNILLPAQALRVQLQRDSGVETFPSNRPPFNENPFG